MERPTPDILAHYQKDIDDKSKQLEKNEEQYLSNETELLV